MANPAGGQFVEVDGLKTFYIKAGSGHPLLLIHGGAPGACSELAWKPVIQLFAQSGFTVYAFDQAGYGLTDNPRDFSMDYRVTHARKLIDKLGVDRYHTIANSQGSYISAKLCLDDPRAKSFISTASATIAPEGSPESAEQAARHSRSLAQYVPSMEAARKLTQGVFYRADLVTDDVVKLRYDMSIGKNLEARQKRQQAPRPKPIVDDLKNIKVKTLLVWGKNDGGASLEKGLLLFQMIADAELHVFDKCGHWAQWDQTARFHRLVCDFLSS